MPRDQPAPEYNVVQNPTITRGLQTMLGMRQAHVIPALTEGLNAELVVGDIRQDPRTRYPLSFASLFEVIGDGVNPPRQEFVNPPDHNRIVQLRRFHAFSHESAVAVVTRLYYTQSVTNYIPTTALKAGTRTMFGYNNGLAPQFFPPTQSYPDITDRSTKAGWLAVQASGITGGYFWNAPWFGTTLPSTYSDILENFDDVRGPRIVLYPGSGVAFGFLDSQAHAYFNMWWDEYPLT